MGKGKKLVAYSLLFLGIAFLNSCQQIIDWFKYSSSSGQNTSFNGGGGGNSQTPGGSSSSKSNTNPSVSNPNPTGFVDPWHANYDGSGIEEVPEEDKAEPFYPETIYMESIELPDDDSYVNLELKDPIATTYESGWGLETYVVHVGDVVTLAWIYDTPDLAPADFTEFTAYAVDAPWYGVAPPKDNADEDFDLYAGTTVAEIDSSSRIKFNEPGGTTIAYTITAGAGYNGMLLQHRLSFTVLAEGQTI